MTVRSGDARGGRWRYRAADERGVETSGEIDAATERDVIDTLRRRSLWAVSVEPLGRETPASDGTAGTRGMVGSAGVRGSVQPRGDGAERLRALRRRLLGPSEATELAVAVRAMAALLEAGVPIDRALEYAAGAAGTPTLQRALTAMVARVRAGASLSGAMAADPLIPRAFAPTIAAAEESGALGRTLSRLADHVERDEATRARLRSALVYPATLGIASAAGVVLMLLVVVPRFAALVADAGGTLPLSTRILVAASTGLVRWWWVLLLLAIAALASWRAWSREPGNRARWHRTRLELPVFGAMERARGAGSYTAVLATALGTGVPLLTAMGLARGTVGNVALATGLAEAETVVRNGGSLGAALVGTLPPLAVRLVDAGEASGTLPDMAARAAEAVEAETVRTTAALVALVEPALILGFGAVVGFVALALLQAIYGINVRAL